MRGQIRGPQSLLVFAIRFIFHRPNNSLLSNIGCPERNAAQNHGHCVRAGVPQKIEGDSGGTGRKKKLRTRTPAPLDSAIAGCSHRTLPTGAHTSRGSALKATIASGTPDKKNHIMPEGLCSAGSAAKHKHRRWERICPPGRIRNHATKPRRGGGRNTTVDLSCHGTSNQYKRRRKRKGKKQQERKGKF